MINNEHYISINQYYKNNNYEDLYREFTKMIFKKAKEYDVVVLTTRRCYCLVSTVYKKFAAVDGYKEELWKKFITSQAVEIDFSSKNNSNFLLVDDVMIHGSAVYSVYEKISDKYPMAAIDTFIMIRNSEFCDHYILNTKKSYDYLYILKETEWSPVSEKIAEYIADNETLYTSYVYDYYFSVNNNKEIFLSALENVFKELNFKLITFNRDKSTSYKNNSLNLWSYKMNSIGVSSKLFIRVYSFDKTIKFIPYIEIEEININALDNIWIELCTKENRLTKITEPSDKVKALTAIIGILIGNRIMEFLNNKNLHIEINREIDKSYFENFSKNIENMHYDYNIILDKLIPKKSDIKKGAAESTKNNNTICDCFIKMIMERSDVIGSELDDDNDGDDGSEKQSSEKFILQSTILENYNSYLTDESNFNMFYYVKTTLTDKGKISVNPLKSDLFESQKESRTSQDGDNVKLYLKVGELSYFMPKEYDNFAFLIAVKYCDDLNLEDKTLTDELIASFVQKLNSAKIKEMTVNNVKYFLEKIKDKNITGIFSKYRVFVKSLSEQEKNELSSIYSLVF